MIIMGAVVMLYLSVIMLNVSDINIRIDFNWPCKLFIKIKNIYVCILFCTKHIQDI